MMRIRLSLLLCFSCQDVAQSFSIAAAASSINPGHFLVVWLLPPFLPLSPCANEELKLMVECACFGSLRLLPQCLTGPRQRTIVCLFRLLTVYPVKAVALLLVEDLFLELP